MSEFLHAKLSFSQYIAPLMADFMTVASNESSVRVFDNGIGASLNFILHVIIYSVQHCNCYRTCCCWQWTNDGSLQDQ